MRSQAEGESNWSGNYVYDAVEVHRPSDVDELRSLLAAAPNVRALGSRHSFTGIGDAHQLISLERLPRELSVDADAGKVWVGGPVTYSELAEILNRERAALNAMASLPHISVAGAVTTATHGSGDDKGNLATSVLDLQVVTSDGEVIEISKGEPDFDGMVVGLGALGVVTRLSLAVEPYYEMRQWVFEGLSWDAFGQHFDELMSSGESVSVFHRFGELIEQVWIKQRADGDVPGRDDLFDAVPATEDRHPVLDGDPVNCTPQLGRPGPWSERLPHFRSGFTPSAGEEIQSEFFVARADAPAAVDALRGLSDSIRPLLLVCELRTIAPDDLWLSPQHGRPTVGIHFTWRRRQAEVEALLVEIEDRLAPFGARPHWAKLFTATAESIAPQYARRTDFLELRERLDPRGALINDWLRKTLIGNPSL
ncbi:MAG: D-arabinono-1,4-lactone oxidase [Solirubrobacteraceae bacterium]